jgi:hypothetical protein
LEKKDLKFIAIWGNVAGFIMMRILGSYNDSVPSYSKSSTSDLFLLVLFFFVMGSPGIYFATREKKEIDFSDIIRNVFFTAMFATIFGLIGIALGRTYS